MKTLINHEEEQIAKEVYELARALPVDVLRDFRTMLVTAKMLLVDKEQAPKGA